MARPPGSPDIAGVVPLSARRPVPSSLLARAEARWQQIEAEAPAPALRLHRRLLTRQIRLAEDGSLCPADLRVLDAGAVEYRLGSEIPVLRDIHVPGVPVERVAEEMLAFLDELAWGGAGEAAQNRTGPR
jgi:hypothetical protein